MLISESTIKLVTIAYASVALFGAFLVLCTAFKARNGIDIITLRAKAFLNESFLRDNGILLLIVCFLFFIHTAMELNPIFRLSVDESVVEFIKELTELGISICVAILAYKWLFLINLSRHLEANGEQDSHSAKRTVEEAITIPQDNLSARR